jgi:ArsR family transcriptional regulator
VARLYPSNYFDYSRNMDMNSATKALGALAQESRLATFRLLVRVGADGLTAGDIARALGIRQNTLSTHLSVLAAAGLISAQRDGRTIIYRVDQTGMRSLLGYLVEDCCEGRPELCEFGRDPNLTEALGAID